MDINVIDARKTAIYTEEGTNEIYTRFNVQRIFLSNLSVIQI
jgi:hypothetical protein